MLLLPKETYLPYFDKILEFIHLNKDETDPTKFTDMEYEKFRRVRDYFANTNYTEEKINEGRKDFYNWFEQYDQRRGTDFLKVFPEMKDFHDICRLEK